MEEQLETTLSWQFALKIISLAHKIFGEYTFLKSGDWFEVKTINQWRSI